MQRVQPAAATQGGYVIAVGGDGLLNEVVNGILEAGVPNGVVAGVLPSGSGNDFAKSIEVQDTPAHLLSLIQHASIYPLDVGKMEFLNPEGNTATRYFINIADIGLGGEVMQAMQNSKQRFGADFAYSWAILKGFFTYRKKVVRLVTPEMEWEGLLLSLVMANGRYFGSGYCIAPHADLANGQFALVILGKVSVFDYIRHLPAIRKGKHIDHPEVTYTTATSLEVEGIQAPLCIEMDGEFIGTTPITLSIQPQVLPFLANRT